ncbi:hypothetical protein LNP17_16575 [Klebsiella variicola subsp. variicola]|nr:hypothetical protein [Klebsiella variicola subsp. variicola]
MSTTLAATHYSPSAVHTLLEVSMGEMTAARSWSRCWDWKIKRQPDGLSSAGGR